MTNIVPYSFDEIQEIMRQEAIDSQLVSDAEYEGSNIAQMIRVMSYAAQSCNISATYGVNEMLLTQTTEYNNVLKLARQLGYIPKQKVSYRYLLNLRPNDEGSYKIPKYSKFSSGDYTYYYFGTEISRVFQYYITVDFDSDVTILPTIERGDEVIMKNFNKATILEILDNPDNSSSNMTKILKLDFTGTIIDSDVGIELKVCSPNGTLKKEGILNALEDSRFEEIEIKEGILYKHYDEDENVEGQKDLFRIIDSTMPDDSTKPLNYLDFNYYNIEEDGIELWVTHFDDSGQLKIKEPWEKRDYFIVDKDIFEERATYLPLTDIDLDTLRIYFEIADTGTTPKLYSKIYVNLLETHGAEGKAITPFELETLDDNIWNIEDPDNLVIQTVGKDIESIESVRTNAPTFHNTANRAVTRLDYISICDRDNGISRTQCWGGETDLPIQHLGHIFFSFLPSYRPQDFLYDSTSTKFVLNKQINDDSKFNLREDEIRAVTIQNNSNVDVSTLGIFDTLESYKIITMALHHRWNYFLDIDLVVDIRKYYVTQSVDAVNIALHKEIVNYFHEVVEVYDYDFFRSNIVRIIDEQLGITTGLELSMSTKIDLYPEHLEKVFEGSNVFKNDIWFGFPFDGVLDEYEHLDPTILKLIDTPDFLLDRDGIAGNELYIRRYRDTGHAFTRPDGTVTTGIFLGDDEILELDICYGSDKGTALDLFDPLSTIPNDPVVGRFFINNKDKTLLVRIYSNNTELAVPSTCYSTTDLDKYSNSIINTEYYNLFNSSTLVERDPLRINITYPFNDINFHKNTIPRLTSIQFK